MTDKCYEKLRMLSAVLAVALCGSVWANSAHVTGNGKFVIDGNLPAGNVVVEKINGDSVLLSRELRDTARDWFYWGFRVKGAAGRTLTFSFDKRIWLWRNHFMTGKTKGTL